jgi:hypothetical protein
MPHFFADSPARLPEPHEYPEGADWPAVLHHRLNARGCTVFADADHLVVVARGRIPDWDALLLRTHADKLHPRLLAEQGRPITEAEHWGLELA